MNVILAQVVNEYDANADERRHRNTDFALRSLQKAYKLLTEEEADIRKSERARLNDSAHSTPSQREQIDKKTVMDLFEILNSGKKEDWAMLCLRSCTNSKRSLMFSILFLFFK
jgi:hypothetical protein